MEEKDEDLQSLLVLGLVATAGYHTDDFFACSWSSFNLLPPVLVDGCGRAFMIQEFPWFYKQEIIVGPTIHAVQPLTFEDCWAAAFWNKTLPSDRGLPFRLGTGDYYAVLQACFGFRVRVGCEWGFCRAELHADCDSSC